MRTLLKRLQAASIDLVDLHAPFLTLNAVVCGSNPHQNIFLIMAFQFSFVFV